MSSKPKGPEERSSGPFLMALFAAWALLAAASTWDALLVRPGLAAFDELAVSDLVQRALEGDAIPWRYGSGRISLALFEGSAWALGGGWGSLRAVSLGFLLIESFALFAVARRLLTREASLATALVGLCSAFTLLRARTALAFVALPCFLLLGLWLLPKARKAWSALALGAAIGLLHYDYEAWAFTLPIFFLAWRQIPSDQRPSWAALLAGWALGAGCVTLTSAPYWQAYAQARLGQAWGAGLGQAAHNLLIHLGQVLLGYGPGDFILGPSSMLPGLVLPFVLLGAVHAWRKGAGWLLGFAALGLLPLGLPAELAESNRAIAAWPALCLLAGFGWQALAQIISRPPRRAVLAGLLLALLALQASRDYASALDPRDRATFGPSRRMAMAADFLRQEAPDAELLSDMAPRSMGEFRFLLGPASRPKQGPLWALIPGDYAPEGLPLSWGEWTRFRDRPGGPELYLLKVAGPQAERLRNVHAFMRELWHQLPRVDAAATLQSTGWLLRANPQIDPWVRACLWDIYLRASQGKPDPAAMQALLQEKLPSPTPQGLARAMLSQGR